MQPPSYRWSVSLAGGSSFAVDAAYPVLDDNGHMLLKDPDHKIVFAAQPGTGCTFIRGAVATAVPVPCTVPLTVTRFPEGCACTYTYTSDLTSPVPAVRWARNINWGCKADHVEVDGTAVLTAGSGGGQARD